MRKFVILWTLALLLLGCARIPDQGPVHRVNSNSEEQQAQLPNFAPPGPEPGADPETVARGFLRSMTAVPFTSSTPRKFLTDEAANSWKLDGGTLVYSAVRIVTDGGGVALDLTISERLNGFGSWERVRKPNLRIPLEMTRQKGEWRIANPSNQLIVPQPYFIDAFQRMSLYFFDQTDRAMVATPVFLLRGEQMASELVRSLLAGPAPVVSDILHSAIPPSGEAADLSVLVSEKGIAQVPVGRAILDLPPEQLNKAMSQLAWTLRQVDGVSSVQLTVDGAPAPLPGQENAIPVSGVDEFNALTGNSTVWGLQGGRLVTWRDRTVVETTGPLGQQATSWSSIATNDRLHLVAAVSPNGHSLYLAPTGTAGRQTTRKLVLTGKELLRPSFDALGNLWVVDRNDGHARVWMVRDGEARQVTVPGVTRGDVRALSVSGEGARLALLQYRGGYEITVVNLLRGPAGDFESTGRTRTIPIANEAQNRVVPMDLGWRNSDTLTLMTSGPGLTSFSYLSSDGSPADPKLITTTPLFERAQWLVVSPDSALPIAIGTKGDRLFMMSSTGGWREIAAELAAPTYSR
jgi:hypothetical protein